MFQISFRQSSPLNELSKYDLVELWFESWESFLNLSPTKINIIWTGSEERKIQLDYSSDLSNLISEFAANNRVTVAVLCSIVNFRLVKEFVMNMLA